MAISSNGDSLAALCLCQLSDDQRYLVICPVCGTAEKPYCGPPGQPLALPHQDGIGRAVLFRVEAIPLVAAQPASLSATPTLP